MAKNHTRSFLCSSHSYCHSHSISFKHLLLTLALPIIHHHHTRAMFVDKDCGSTLASFYSICLNSVNLHFSTLLANGRSIIFTLEAFKKFDTLFEDTFKSAYMVKVHNSITVAMLIDYGIQLNVKIWYQD